MLGKGNGSGRLKTFIVGKFFDGDECGERKEEKQQKVRAGKGRGEMESGHAPGKIGGKSKNWRKIRR